VDKVNYDQTDEIAGESDLYSSELRDNALFTYKDV
jgi:hypothetical protein